MSDLFGLLELPAAPAPPDTAVTDPLLDMLLSFMTAVLNADLGRAWADIAAADPDPVSVVFTHDPDLESFDTNATPALYAWRGPDGGHGKYAQDVVADDSSIQCLWVPPPVGQEDRALREPIRNGIKKSLKAAFQKGRHPAWVIPGDDYYDPATGGSVLLKHARLASARLGQFRPHKLIIEGESHAVKSTFDCLFFTVETLELLATGTDDLQPLDHIEGTVTLPARIGREADPDGVPLDFLMPTQTVTYHLEHEFASIDTATGPAAGGTVVTLTGRQFVEDMVATFGGGVATYVTLIDESTLQVTTPAHAAGVVDIVLTAPSGVAKTLAAAFTYA